MKVYMYKFMQGSIYDGRDVGVQGAQFTLVETRVVRAKNREETYRDVCEVARIQVHEGWRKERVRGTWRSACRFPPRQRFLQACEPPTWIFHITSP